MQTCAHSRFELCCSTIYPLINAPVISAGSAAVLHKHAQEFHEGQLSKQHVLPYNFCETAAAAAMAAAVPHQDCQFWGQHISTGTITAACPVPVAPSQKNGVPSGVTIPVQEVRILSAPHRRVVALLCKR